MKQISVGTTGWTASPVVLGCMRIDKMDEAAVDRHIHGALELGIDYFDHADIYGGGVCEEKFGQFLKNNPGLRDKMKIQSKCGIRKGMYDFSAAHLEGAVDGILHRLGIERLDTLLLHRPDALMEPEEVAGVFDRLHQAGKVAHFGVSNFDPFQLELLQRSVSVPLEFNQMQFGLGHRSMIDQGICANTPFAGAVDRDGGTLDYCRLKGITIQAWSPFQYGFFEGVFLGDEKFAELNAALDEVAAAHGVTPMAVATAWILRHPAKMQVIAGTTRLDRLAEICAGAEMTLSREEWYRLYLAAGSKLP